MAESNTPKEGGPVNRSASNASTLAGYEDCAIDYAQTTAPRPEASDQPGLVELLKLVEPESRLLEIGSGPGWDADWLEERGLVVRRTDAAESFLHFQASRGRHAERLDVIRDLLGGPYDGVVALYVLQHVERDLLPTVFARIAQAISDGGVFLLALREGRARASKSARRVTRTMSPCGRAPRSLPFSPRSASSCTGRTRSRAAKAAG